MGDRRNASILAQCRIVGNSEVCDVNRTMKTVNSSEFCHDITFSFAFFVGTYNKMEDGTPSALVSALFHIFKTRSSYSLGLNGYA